MSTDLHASSDPIRREYYDAVFEALKRCIAEGNAFALLTEPEGDRTHVTFSFESASLSPYMAHLAPDDGPILTRGPSLPPE
jgi:hypothetical protein